MESFVLDKNYDKHRACLWHSSLFVFIPDYVYEVLGGHWAQMENISFGNVGRGWDLIVEIAIPTIDDE